MSKVQIFLEGRKNLKKTPTLFWCFWLLSKRNGAFFFKFCGLLTISELFEGSFEDIFSSTWRMIYFFSLVLIFNNQIFFTLSFLQCWLLLYALLWKKKNLVIIARFFPDLNLKKINERLLFDIIFLLIVIFFICLSIFLEFSIRLFLDDNNSVNFKDLSAHNLVIILEVTSWTSLEKLTGLVNF